MESKASVDETTDNTVRLKGEFEKLQSPKQSLCLLLWSSLRSMGHTVCDYFWNILQHKQLNIRISIRKIIYRPWWNSLKLHVRVCHVDGHLKNDLATKYIIKKTLPSAKTTRKSNAEIYKSMPYKNWNEKHFVVQKKYQY